MVDFKIGYKEKRYLLTVAMTLAGLSLLIWTKGAADIALKYNISAMPNLLSVNTAVAVILFWGVYGLLKNRI